MTYTLPPPPPRSHARLWISTLLLAVYTAFVLVVTMWPRPDQLEFGGIADRVLRVLYRFGVPEWFGFNELEFTANIGMFVPLGFLLGLALPRKAWWVALFLLPAFSGGIELAQGLALSERVSTVFDVAANTIGGYTGLLLAMIIRALIYVRDRTVIEREIWERNAAYVRAREALRARNEPEPVDLATKIFDREYWAQQDSSRSGDAPTMRLPSS